MPNYENGKIYKITNDYNDDIYIGSTCECLNKRFHKHRYDSKKDINKNIQLYKLMNEVGFVRFRIDLIENYPCNDKISLTQREGYFIRQMGTLNRRIEGRTKKEYKMNWNEENANKVKEQNKEYYEKNKDKINEYQKNYSQENKGKINERKKKNYQENKGKIKEKQREYSQENKDHIKQYKKEYYQRKKLEKLEKENLAI